jgi:uncharacterized protein (TIGR02246 family)
MTETKTQRATYESVSAGIHATIAAHAHAQDDGRTDDLVALYTPDGVVVVPGVATLEGAEEIRTAFEKWKPKVPQRHMVANILVTQWNDKEAKAISDVVYLTLGDGVWTVQIVARYQDTFRYTDGTWLLSRRADEYVAWTPPENLG